MVGKKRLTIDELKTAIRKRQTKDANELERRQLEGQLKIMNRSPGTKRTIELFKRTGRGFKKLTFAGGKAILNQGRLIKEQQMREDAKFSAGQKKTGRIVKRKLKRTNKTISKKLKRTAKRKRRSKK